MSPLKLSVEQIIARIEAKERFEAMSADGGFTIKINQYVPYLCTAIHDGSNLREDLLKQCALSDYQRWYEEDPFTGELIWSLPITIIGHDSRFEYDLNRRPEHAIHEKAWGLEVWKKNPLEKQRQISLDKHANFYRVLDALVTQLESSFGGCVLFDIHSYNYRRWDREVPVFNVGTEKINKEKFGGHVDFWKSELGKIKLSDQITTVAENDVFYGRGYLLEHVSSKHDQTLVLASEIKKIFCDEETGDAFPKVIRSLQKQLQAGIANTANNFSKSLNKWQHVNAAKLLNQEVEPAVVKLDKHLFNRLKTFELLAAVNPKNVAREKKRFFKSGFRQLPQFEYNPVKLSPFVLKKELVSGGFSNVKDITLKTIYELVASSFFDKIDLINSLDTKHFLYNSIRYFGRPSKLDLSNAEYLLRLPDIPGEAKKEPMLNVDQAMDLFKTTLSEYGIKAKVGVSNKVISQVMVLSSKRSIVFQPGAKFRRKHLLALLEHEIGVHMVTTANAAEQPLKIYHLGMPLNTKTQEGMAILSEYLSGNITLDRLRTLALRVIAVDALCNGADFIECFELLHSNWQASPDKAFDITTRVYRGGGFTKDYLYLSGFTRMLKFWKADNSIKPLLVGKTSLSLYNETKELIDRNILSQPKYITNAFSSPTPEKNHEVYSYILSGLK